MNIKHSKYKNTGILFELLVRQITADTLSGNDSPATNILKKYFTKTELGREYKIYESFFKNTNVSDTRADMVISTLIESSKQLNRSSLKRQKYNLIKEIKQHYDLEEFFKAKIHNYKAYAAISNLLEAQNSLEFIDPSFVINNKVTLLEFLTKQNIDKDRVEDQVMKEYASQDKATRALISKVMIEKFNEKYANLLPEQRNVLKT